MLLYSDNGVRHTKEGNEANALGAYYALMQFVGGDQYNSTN